MSYYDDELPEFDEFSEDDEIDKENTKEILLAELNWSPQLEYMPWTDPDFAKKIVDRLRGVTEESFASEVELWQQQINLLPNYNELELRNEIRSWDISIPSKDTFDFESFAMSYSKQVQYRVRLTELMSVVYAHNEMLSQAQKTLLAMAVKLSNGPKHDKDANATFTVHPFSIAATHSKRLMTYLENVLKNIDFAASQMDRMLREHQALSRINHTMNSEGMSYMANKDYFGQNPNNSNSVKIRTRNSR
jgi:hypothetical protein